MKQLLARKNNKQSGFTIVELLIVIIVIMILTAITYVSYIAISNRSRTQAVSTDLQTTVTELTKFKAENGAFPTNATFVNIKTSNTSSKTVYRYVPDTPPNGYCVEASGHGATFSVISGSTEVLSTPCPEGSMNGMAIQTITPTQCAALPTFTGSNDDAVRSVTDSRGGTTRTYQVAKLADGKCWMLNNLKLGSTTGTTTLTPADSNVAANFTLPQLITTGASSYDAPQAIGPVPGDTGTGATNYGYLYNWPAATAGASRTSNPAGSGDAQYSICPANWRLPSGGDTGEFAMLNAKMNNATATTPSASGGTGYYQNWQATGPFKGAFSGWRSGSFNAQGSYGHLWSRSAHASAAGYAHSAYFGSSYVNPDYSSNDRYYGFGVRCLLN